MGDNADPTAAGIFYLRTKSEPPFNMPGAGSINLPTSICFVIIALLRLL